MKLHRILPIVLACIGTLLFVQCNSSKKSKASDTEVKVYKDGYELQFKGVGHEPEWNVMVTDSTIVYRNINLPEEMNFPNSNTYHIMDVAGLSYSGTNSKGERIHVQILKESCQDTMMDLESPFSVDVSLGDRNLGTRGCGEYLEDGRLNGKWFLETFRGKDIPESDPELRPAITFTSKTNQIGCYMGCNSMGGGYILMENRIMFNPGFVSTLMHCDDKMGLENEFSKVIVGQTIEYKFKGSRLIFSHVNGTELMSFRNK